MAAFDEDRWRCGNRLLVALAIGHRRTLIRASDRGIGQVSVCIQKNKAEIEHEIETGDEI